MNRESNEEETPNKYPRFSSASEEPSAEEPKAETAEEPEVSSVSEAAACSPMAMRTPAPSVHVVAPATDASRGSGAASYARDLVRDIWRRARPKCHVLGASWPCTPRATEVEGELPAKRRRVFDSVSTPKFWL